MAVVFNSLSELSAYIETAVNGALADTVVPEVEADFIDNALADIYNEYDPFVYERSYSLTYSSAYSDEVGGMSATINISHPHGQLIEYGQGSAGDYYQYPYNRDDTAWKFLNPRPFYRHTIEKLRDGRFKELMAQGLREYGLDVH